MPLVIEGIVTTLNDDGTANVSPMGGLVDRAISQLTLRPFQSSQTFKNLLRHPEGVLHVTDDVELLAHAAVNQLAPPVLRPAQSVAGVILADACRWYEFRVRELDEREDRVRMDCDIVTRGQIRDFFGFNRAKHAVVEAAILATRVGILPAGQIREEFQRLRVIVEKTAGDQEERAFEFLAQYIRRHLDAPPPPA